MEMDPHSAGSQARERAHLAWNLGYISVILCLVTPCGGCMPLLGALPVSLMALQLSRTALAASPDEVSEVHARHGMATGLLSLIYSGLLLAMVLLYVLLYVGIFAAALLGTLTSL